jgi:hypothetical protein
MSREFGNSILYLSPMEHLDRDIIRSQIRDSTTLDLLNENLVGRISSKFGWASNVGFFYIMSHHLLMISSEDDLFRTSAH